MIKMIRKLEMTKVMKMNFSITSVVYLDMLTKKIFPQSTFANSSATSTCQDTGVTRAP